MGAGLRSEEEWEAEIKAAPPGFRFAIVERKVTCFINGHPHTFAQDPALKRVLRRLGAPEVANIADLPRDWFPAYQQSLNRK